MLTRSYVECTLNVPCLIYRQKHLQLNYILISSSILNNPRDMYSDTWIAS